MGVRAVLLSLLLLALSAVPASANASHEGWPTYDMLLMNKTSSSRPLDARPGRDPFGGRDRKYRCDAIHLHSDSCFPRLVAKPPDVSDLLPAAAKRLLDRVHHMDAEEALGAGLKLAVTDKKGHNELLGGHGDDTIHAGPWGDVIWGDYKPTHQTTHQKDKLVGGDGPDFIYPSHGRNVIHAGKGSDVIHGLYGHGVIDCGPGRDAVYLPSRYNAYKYRHCEFKRHRFGESAPKWLLKKLPWYHG